MCGQSITMILFVKLFVIFILICECCVYIVAPDTDFIVRLITIESPIHQRRWYLVSDASSLVLALFIVGTTVPLARFMIIFLCVNDMTYDLLRNKRLLPLHRYIALISSMLFAAVAVGLWF